MAKKCPKCDSVLKPSNASYCVACETYLDIKPIKEKHTAKKYNGKLCALLIFLFWAYIITSEIWAYTEVGSLLELITDIILYILLYAFVAFLLIFVSKILNHKIDKTSKRGKPGVDLSFLKSEKRKYYILYYIFILILILISFTSFYIDNGRILLVSLFTLLSIVSLILIPIRYKKVKYWINVRDIIAILAIFLMIISIWGKEFIYNFIYFIGIIGLYVWIVWFVYDLIKRKIGPIKWIGLIGIILIVVGMILHRIFESFYFSFIYYLGLYVWIGFFVSELLQRNKVPGLDFIDESKVFENLVRDSKILVKNGNKFYLKEDYSEAVDNWETSLKFYEKALEIALSNEQKEKIKNNQKKLKENLRNALKQSAKLYNKKAIKSHEKSDLQKAEKEWIDAIQDFIKLIDLIKSEKPHINYDNIETKIKSIRKNLEQLEIEKLCLTGDEKLVIAQTLQDRDLTEAIKMVNEIFSLYSKALAKAKKNAEFKSLIEKIKTRIVNIRNFQSELRDKMDELIGITPLTIKVMIKDLEDSDYRKVDTILKAKESKKALTIIREYEFIGGQVRFKIGLINKTNSPLTNFKIIFDLPDALKWIMHEPNKYERKGDSISISKLGKNETKAVSLYLEPINCMKSPINATIIFFDAKDRPQAVPMKPKMISITCPIFFTREEANLARVKRLQRSLTHRDKKLFPIVNIDEISLIFSTTLLVLGDYDIKLISKEFSEKDKFGEAWFYGTTKVKKNRIITYILLDGESKTLEIEVSADNEEQITAFLAELGNKIRNELKKRNIIDSEEQFYDISMSIHLNHCPYCWSIITAEFTQKYIEGESIKCKYCNEILSLKEKY